MSLKNTIFVGLLSVLVLGPAIAEDGLAPTPRKMPRAPVNREALPGNKQAMPSSRTLTGAVAITDSEKLQIGGVDLRLFGVVPPSLSASYGPQARAVLDGLTAAGAVTCVIRDRSRDGRFLATCRSASGADLALELLKRGLAATARGSLQPTDLAEPYQAAEQAAQAQRLGLWSVSIPPAVSDTVIRDLAKGADVSHAAKPTPVSPSVSAASMPQEPAVHDRNTDNKPVVIPEPKAESAIVPVTTSSAAEQAPRFTSVPPSSLIVPLDEASQALASPIEAGFFERYQLFLTGLLMFITVLGVAMIVIVQRWLDHREEVRSIAAALRGELMAARALCLARLNAGTSKEAAKDINWPRVRSLVFQAYVGRLGLLGSTMARQIASIYGQASDYAAYYKSRSGAESSHDFMPKKESLQTLLRHIDEVLPRLVTIEQRGSAGFGTGLWPGQFSAKRWLETRQKTDENRMSTDMAAQQELMPSPVPAAHKPVPSPKPLWDVIRKFAVERLERKNRQAMDVHVPDYGAYAGADDAELPHYGGAFDFDEDITLPPDEKTRHHG